MGKKRKISLTAIILVVWYLCLGISIMTFASDIDENIEEVRIEGASSCMPDIKIYCYPARKELLDGVSVTYAEEELDVLKVLPFEETQEGSNYYMLLDVSASVSQAYFAQMKTSILDFWAKMGTTDQLTLITFGDKVQVVFQDKTVTDDISEQVNAIENTDQNTCLFEAIDKAAKLADTKKQARRRKITMALTDGEDFSENTSTKEEALATLKEKMMPLYAMAAKENNQGGENAYLDSMGVFVRDSGGVMEVFAPQDAVLKMQNLQQVFREAYVIQAKAQSNVIDYQKKPLNLAFADGIAKTAQYRASFYQEDTSSPNAKVKKHSDYALKITYSEPVTGAEQVSGYEITHDDEKITDGYMVRYKEKEKQFTAIITFEEKLMNGKYKITFHGITDRSMEQNPLKKTCSIKIKDGEKDDIADYIMKYQAFLVGLLVLIVILAAIALMWIKIKKQGGIVTLEGKAVLQSNVQKKHQIKVQKNQSSKKQIQFFLDGMISGKRQITVDIDQSIIVGRSSVCEVYIDDDNISRQHFVICDQDGAFYIQDLNSKNGTFVNGQKIMRSKKLENGDKIKFGNIIMTVRW